MGNFGNDFTVRFRDWVNFGLSVLDSYGDFVTDFVNRAALADIVF